VWLPVDADRKRKKSMKILNKMNINMKTEEMMVYEAPQVSVIEVEVEKGFAASEPALSDFGFGGDLSGN